MKNPNEYYSREERDEMADELRDRATPAEGAEPVKLISSDQMTVYGYSYATADPKDKSAGQTANIGAWYETACYWKHDAASLREQLAPLTQDRDFWRDLQDATVREKGEAITRYLKAEQDAASLREQLAQAQSRIAELEGSEPPDEMERRTR